MSLDSQRFREFADRSKEPLYQAAFRILGRHDESLDVLQDTLLECARRLSRFDDQALLNWARRVAINRSLDILRARKRQRKKIEEWAHRQDQSESEPEQDDAIDTAMGLLSELPQRQQQVLALRVMDDQSFVRIAEDLGISEGATKVHFRRALKTLRDRWNKVWRSKNDEQ